MRYWNEEYTTKLKKMTIVKQHKHKLHLSDKQWQLVHVIAVINDYNLEIKQKFIV